MEIKQYNYDTKVEYSKFVRKYNKSKQLKILSSIKFIKGKNIFLILKRGIFRKYIIIGYTIIDEDMRIIYFRDEINEKYIKNDNIIYITDFMIDYLYRNQGIGKKFANYIINGIYENKNIILQPKGDGNWFWKKFGFVEDNISKRLTLILKRT